MFITFLSDFGLKDDFVGTCHGVMKRIAPDTQIIDITHGIPPQAVLQGALVLANTIGFMPLGVHLAIVDPGVGGPRRPLVLRDEEGRLYVGPDNGLLLPAASRAGIAAAHELANPEYALETISRTFHGRDLFSPAAAHLARGVAVEDLGPPVDPEGLVRLDVPELVIGDGAVVATLLYVDSFGNIALNLDPRRRGGLGIVSGTRVELELAGERYYALMARTFADARPGDVILYEDSYKNMSLAISREALPECCTRRPGRRSGSRSRASRALCQETGGLRSAHGRAASSCAASLSKRASPAGGPIACTPMGRPLSLQCRGTDIAGRPVRLAIAVNGVNAVLRRSCSMAPSASSCHPIGTGGSARVGVRTMSNSLPERHRAAGQRLQPNDGTSVVGRRACERGFHESTVERCEQRGSSTGWSAGPTCQTAMNVRSRSGSARAASPLRRHGRAPSSRAAAEASAATHSGSTGTSTGGTEVTATRNVPGGSITLSANGRSGGGAHQGSPGSYPARTSSRWAASTTDRAIGPRVERPSRDAERRARHAASGGLEAEDAATRGRNPDRAAAVGSVGDRGEARPRGLRPRLRSSPPACSSIFHGFRVAPFRSDSVKAVVPNSGVFVLPRITKPASRSRRDNGHVEVGNVSA